MCDSLSRGQAWLAPYLYGPPPTPSRSLTAESPLDLSLKNNHHVGFFFEEEEATARGGSTGSSGRRGKKSAFLPPFTPVGNCETAPGLSPRLQAQTRRELQRPSAAGAPPSRSRAASQRICRRSGIPPPVPFIAPLVRWQRSRAPPTPLTPTAQRASRNSLGAAPTFPNKGNRAMYGKQSVRDCPFLFLIPFI